MYKHTHLLSLLFFCVRMRILTPIANNTNSGTTIDTMVFVNELVGRDKVTVEKICIHTPLDIYIYI